ncbi:Protein ovarian tumor locus [Lucilia cuprina]|uniref:Protein ovarian tumor locus n=1 Tax=Lucilia cuprina TaxID=7375 RepID=A0A0L0C2D9_LUCCU|nr:Protein ovarian tumor locus [Lucilia cuprina]
MQRQFTSGSRQAPDPFDQFLEEHNFYRKHTARDASCLFRVISEQMYDTQLHHLAIREKCVTYMRKHRKHFDYHVDRDFDEYLDDMSKPKTYGTLLELQAASYMFERNVFLFQPFNLGNYFSEYRSNFVEVFRVFYTPERHFDSVFTSDYIQEAAICQSICYEILYKDLFKLPDVSFAVEQMLHGPTFENMDYRTETNEEGYSTRLHLSDGRSFELDLPHNTNCILENYKLCHFHYINFPRYSDDLQRELKNANNCEEYDKNSLIIQRTAESFLPNKYVSCVRQLLQEGITPFPYKVAKALDPNMYRNIEFDSWNEMRKELKLQNWYNGDANFKVGAKCHVKLRKSEQDLYTCHIQEIAVDKGQCIVFVEQLGEKRLVPYENLTPLPPDQFKPWTVPYRLQRHMQKYSSVRFTRQYNYRFKFNTTTEHHHHHEFACGSAMDNDSCSNDYIDDDLKKSARQQHNQHCTTAASYFKLKQYTHLEDFRTHVEYCTMPLTVAHAGREVDAAKSGNQQRGISDSNENSRTPSRSSTTVGTQRNNMEAVQNKALPNSGPNNVDDNLVAPQAFAVPHFMEAYDVDHYNPNAALYMPEMQSFYPMYPYSTAAGIPEDYYGYCGFDGGLPPGAAFMPAVNNGFYYLCNNTLAPPGNYINSTNPYFPPPPPAQSLGIGPMVATANTPNASYYTQTPLTSAATSTQSVQSLAPPSNTQPSSNNTPSRLPQRSVTNTPTNTPLSGRINYDAKKSLKANGIDLPNDVATLRFFYNMGLDYYHKQKNNENETPSNEDTTNKLSNDLQNIKLDENANQVSSTKSDANNNDPLNVNQNEMAASNETNSSTTQSNKHSNTGVNSSTGGGGGNKNNNNNNNNNQRRYSSRYFSGKERQMSQRNNNNNTNQNSQNSNHHQHQQQQQQQHHNQNHSSQRNQGNYNNNANKYSQNNYNSSSNTTNTSRNTQQHHLQTLQQHQQQQQPQHLNPHHAASSEQSRQISPTCGFDEAAIRVNSVDSRNSQTPTTNNSNTNTMITYANNSEQINEGLTAGGIGNAGQMSIAMQSTAGGVYIPIPMTGGPPPPAPYGIFAPHPTAAAGAHPANGMGMHPNYMTGPPPQIITHCGLPPPVAAQQHANLSGGMNTAAGSDNMENVCNTEMATNNAAGLIGMPPPGMQIQCPNYPPPMPFYYSANSANSMGGNGVAGAPMPNAANGVHLVSPFSHQVPPSTPSNQTAFASPHPSMATTGQGYYCLQPPPPLPPQQQVTPQLMQPQPSPMSANTRTPNTNSLSHDINTGPRNDLIQQNND